MPHIRKRPPRTNSSAVAIARAMDLSNQEAVATSSEMPEAAALSFAARRIS